MSSARSKGRASREAIVIWSFGAVPPCDLVNVRGVEGGVNVVDRDEWNEGETNVSVPKTRSPYATWEYSCRRPPSPYRRVTSMSASMGPGSARSGQA
jgi:hypothetical protein